MSRENSGEASGINDRKLRLWPGVVALVLLWLARFGTKVVMPGFTGFSRGMMASMALGLVIVLWWLFFSRARWLDRLGGLVLLAASVGVAWGLKHESMGPHWLVGYALPVLYLAFVGSLVATQRMPEARRRLVVAVTVLLVGAGWALLRTDGIDGDHDGIYAWRWSETVEQQLAGQEDGSGRTASLSLAEAPAWPGFRGPGRDGVSVSGSRISTDWSAAPPAELWRRPVGPGWSSLAVHGEFFFTQEQRGEDEVVACYRVDNGEPVWIHRDPTRFFESNGGAGPRGTPTLSGDRVYTLGATGILNALSALDGAVVWSKNVATDAQMEIPEWAFSSSPLVIDEPAGERLVVVAASGTLVAYELDAGDLRWTGPEGGISYSSPQPMSFDGMSQVVLVHGDGVTGVDPADGSRLWQYDWSGYPMVQPAQMPNGDLLISASEGSGIRRLAISRGSEGWQIEEVWRTMGLKPYFNDFVIHEGHAYGFDSRILSSIDLRDGKRKWKGGRYGSGQLILLPDQDLLLVLSEKGELALVEAKTDGFKELARIPGIQGKTWNHPVRVEDVLLVRNAEEMAAFRLPNA